MKKSTFLGAFILGIFWLVSSASSIAAQEKKAPALTLSDGQYEMQVTYKFYDEDKIMPNINVTVAVTVKDEKLTVTLPVINQPLALKITGNTLAGQLSNDSANVQFQGEIVERDHTEGVFFGSFGQKKLTGIWSLKLPKKETPKQKDS